MTQYGQSFLCSIADSSLESSPRDGSLDHLADTTDTIDHRLLIDDQSHVLEIGVPMKQPRCSDKERGLTITQRS
jgi:hypothetical protein